MSAFDFLHLRPRFAFSYNCRKDILLKELSNHFQIDESCKGKLVINQVKIDILKTEQKYYSPQMTFAVEEDKTYPEQSYIHGLVGPRPEIWTMFMFSYFIIGVLGFFASLYGLSQMTLGLESYSSIWAMPLALLLIGTGYFVSKTGEKLSHEQISKLKHYAKKGLGPNFDDNVLRIKEMEV